MTNRNRCKACRFRRCIDEGMSVDGKCKKYSKDEQKENLFLYNRRENGSNTKIS